MTSFKTSFKDYVKAQNRKDKEMEQSRKESLFVKNVESLVSRYRSSNRKAADVWHRHRRRGDEAWYKWLNDNVVDIWEKAGLPDSGNRKWQRVEDEIVVRFLADNPQLDDPKSRFHYLKGKIKYVRK